MFHLFFDFMQGAEGSPVVASANEAPLWMLRKTYLLLVHLGA